MEFLLRDSYDECMDFTTQLNIQQLYRQIRKPTPPPNHKKREEESYIYYYLLSTIYYYFYMYMYIEAILISSVI